MSGTLALVWSLVVASAAADPMAAIEARLVRGVPVGGLFTQRVEVPELSRPIVSSGRFWFAANGAVAWYVDRPVEARVTLPADGADAGAGESAADLAWLAGLVRAFVAGDLGALSAGFRIEAQTSGTGWRATLTPVAAPLDGLVRTVALRGDEFVAGLVIEAVSGDRITIDFDDVRALDALPEAVAADLGGLPSQQ